jgi:hypothetical protein
MVSGPWTHRSVNALREVSQIIVSVNQSKEAGAPTLKGPTLSRTRDIELWVGAWRSLTWEDDVCWKGTRAGHIFPVYQKPNRTVPNRTEISGFLVFRFGFGF